MGRAKQTYVPGNRFVQISRLSLGSSALYQKINYAKFSMLYPCIQVYVDSCKGGSDKSLFGTPTLTGFNVVIHKDTFVGAFN